MDLVVGGDVYVSVCVYMQMCASLKPQNLCRECGKDTGSPSSTNTLPVKWIYCKCLGSKHRHRKRDVSFSFDLQQQQL